MSIVPGQSFAAQQLAPWNDALLSVLLPVLPIEAKAAPVLLACDDETVRAAGQILGYDVSDAAEHFGTAVRTALEVQRGEGIRFVLDLKYRWSLLPSPRPRPDFLGVLCLAVLAASRMGPTETNITLAYYPRLRRLLRLPEKGGDPGSFHLIPQLFRDLADWLHVDEHGARGELVVPQEPWPPFVGHCVEQTVFREADRRVLTEFFSEARFRQRGSRLDNLLLLRRWSGRSRLTNHALELLDDERYAQRVRAAIGAAFRAWDGAVLERAGGRSYEARLHLLPRPLRLLMSAGNSRPIRLGFEGRDYELLPERQVQVPWGLLNRSGILLGDPMSPSGALRLPSFEETLLFELFDEEGLRRVVTPTSDTVWVISRDITTQFQLREWTLADGGALPDRWNVYRDVPVDRIPGVQRGTVAEDKPQMAIAGGLRVQNGFYLSDHPPYLEAGDVGAGDELPVTVNGDLVGVIESQQRLPLPSSGPTSYRVQVAGLAFDETYHVDTGGAHEGYGSLSYHPADKQSLRSGALPTKTDARLRVCGAQVVPEYHPMLPIMRRRHHDVVGILADGRAREWSQPNAPPWLALVNYPATSRWEVPRDGVVWLLCLADSEATRWADLALRDLSEQAFRAIRELGLTAVVQDRCGDREAARAAWVRLVGLTVK